MPVARYRCRRPKLESPELDRTFSLLPSCLAPYKRPHIGLMQSLLSLWLLTGDSITDVLDNISAAFSHQWYPAGMFLYRIKALFRESAIKLNQASSFCDLLYTSRGMISPVSFLKLLNGYKYASTKGHIPGAEGLAIAYYFYHGSWEADSHFLFGTAYQHRVSRRK